MASIRNLLKHAITTPLCAIPRGGIVTCTNADLDGYDMRRVMTAMQHSGDVEVIRDPDEDEPVAMVAAAPVETPVPAKPVTDKKGD